MQMEVPLPLELKGFGNMNREPHLFALLRAIDPVAADRVSADSPQARAMFERIVADARQPQRPRRRRAVERILGRLVLPRLQLAAGSSLALVAALIVVFVVISGSTASPAYAGWSATPTPPSPGQIVGEPALLRFASPRGHRRHAGPVHGRGLQRSAGRCRLPGGTIEFRRGRHVRSQRRSASRRSWSDPDVCAHRFRVINLPPAATQRPVACGGLPKGAPGQSKGTSCSCSGTASGSSSFLGES